MPSVADLGKKVKAKFPGAYDDLDDAALGQRVKAKFPGAYDDFADEGPKVGMGDVQAAPSAQTSTGNVPAGMLTGDAGTDQGIAQNLRAQGHTKDITGRDVAGAAAVAASLLAPELGLGPIATGAVSGGLFGGGTSKADDLAGVAKDTAVGGAAGAALPAVLAAAKPLAKPFATWLGEKANEWGRKVITGGYTPLSAKKPISDAAVREAFGSGAIRPLGTTAGTAERLSEHAEGLGDEYAAAVKALEDAGVKGPDVRPVAANLRARAAELERNDVDSAAADTYRALATHLEGGTVKGHMGHEMQVPSKVVPGAGTPPRLVGISREVQGAGAVRDPNGFSLGEGVSGLSPDGSIRNPALRRSRLEPDTLRPRPSSETGVRPVIAEGTPDQWNTELTQAENIKRAAQAKAKYSKIQGDSIMEGARKDQASVLRQAVEDAIEAQKDLAPDAAAKFQPIKQQLGAAIEGRDAATIAAARGTRLKHHSLTDTIMKGAVLSAGGPAALPEAIAMGEASRLGRMRGPSTWGWLANQGEKALSAIPQGAVSPVTAGATAPVADEGADAFLRWLMEKTGAPRLRLSGAAADDEGGR